MTTQDLMTIIGMNITLFALFSTVMYWMINRLDTDVKSVGADVKALSSRLDSHATRIDQLYKMFVDLLKERK